MKQSLLRIVSMLNRNPALPAVSGSFDRTWWAWRMKDMPNMSLQYGVYPLALAYCFADRPFRRSPALLQWISAALRFWCRRQGRRGAFSQLMPNEDSVGTTYYTLSAVLETQRLLHAELPRTLNQQLDQAIVKAAAFLLGHEESYGFIANHVALFAWVDGLLGVRLDSPAHRAAMRSKLAALAAHFDRDEGWFLEYEGADPGYQTQCLYYLARCHELDGDASLLALMKISFSRFLVHFFHANGTFGGNYGARGTEIVYPGGIAYMADEIPEARAALAWLQRAICQQTTPVPLGMDDENCIRLTANYLHTFTEKGHVAEEGLRHELPCFKSTDPVSFPRAGLEIRRRRDSQLIVSTHKGTLRAITRGGQVDCEDAGYTALLGDGRVVSSQVYGASEVAVDDASIEMEKEFFEIAQVEMAPVKQLLLRTLNLTLLRFTFLSRWFKSAMVRLLITRKRGNRLTLRRRVDWNEDVIVVRDTIRAAAGVEVRELRAGGNYQAVTMASGSYAQPSHLECGTHRVVDARTLNQSHEWTTTWRIELS